MAGARRGRISRLSGCVLAASVLAAAGSTPDVTPRPIDPTLPLGLADVSPRPPSTEHRIGVRVIGGAGELFDRETGRRFVPRGFNLIRLAGGSHSTFDVGRYDPDRTDEALAVMARLGYNTVRVFLNTNPGRGGLPSTDEPLSGAYLDNVVDFLHRAERADLVVLPTFDWLPESAHWAYESDPLIEAVNSLYLSAGGLEANARFFRLFASELIERGAPLDALLAYELRNELYFSDLHPPFSLAAGRVTAANGRTYDLASTDERRHLLEDNLIHWLDRMRDEILAVDPTALVTAGFFQPHGPNASRVGDDRLIETSRVISESQLDFVDLHGYPGGDLDLRQIVENFGLPPVTEKPILMGEFGARHDTYPTAEDAVRGMVEWQVESCAYGFDGWLLWTLDSLETPDFWNALDDDGALATALAPATRADPCTVGGLSLSTELARGATARATSALPGFPAADAIDGSGETHWNARAGPPQAITLDLGAQQTIDEIRLLVAQDPPGRSRHVVLVRGARGAWRQVHVFSGRTHDGQWLTFAPAKPLVRIHRVRIETRLLAGGLAPAWKEISILGKTADP